MKYLCEINYLHSLSHFLFVCKSRVFFLRQMIISKNLVEKKNWVLNSGALQLFWYFISLYIFNRPGVAEAVLQSTPVLIDWFVY